MRWVLIILALMVPFAVQAQQWWQGNWTFDPEWCAQVDKIGSVTPAPIAITQDEIIGYENTCSITRAKPMEGIAAVHLHLSCQSEGDTFEEERLLMRTDESGLAIWIWFGSSDPMLFQRCE